MKHAAAALGAVLVLVGCDRFMPDLKSVEGQPAAVDSPADRAASDTTSGEHADAPLQSPVEPMRFHGGRTVAWWKERLELLQRQGTPALYRLTLQRAGAAGLRVVEGPPLTVSEIEVAR
jgi:hypothetical protein